MNSGIGGIILAGGASRRMGGGDKGLLRLNSQTLLDCVAGRLSSQVGHLALNANGNPERFAGVDIDIIADPLPEPVGPLGGVLAGCLWSRRTFPKATHIVTVAVDTPFFPSDLVDRLFAAASPSRRPVLAECGTRLHPVFALWPVEIADHLARHLAEGGTRRVSAYALDHLAGTVAEFPMEDGFDPFFNINTPDDLDLARQRLLGNEA
ncbi:molybdenum cofactor guanylyltransferase MobA [Nitratireductor sp. GISD-1A_MAKvit]|uniref:molybdenum cofactor guanylyltransferase MobA n=1 Tax=Nitratireductor sp. GISD-1A_MAKvit TaxID=3234198 RepID=UPI003466840A